jgi:hypothetical protein
MKQRLLCLTLAAAFAASVAVADAGQRHGGSSSGSSSSGSSGSSGGGGSSSSSGGGSSSSGGGGGSSESSSPPSRGSGSGAVPRHGGADSGSRSGGSSAGRSGGSSNDGGSASTGAVRRHPDGGSTSGSGRDNASAGVPDYSRPRSGRPVAGYAVPRGNVVPPARPGGDYHCCYISPYNWYYDPWAFGTFGLGYIYDPFWWGGGYPYGGYGGYNGYGYGYGGGYGGGGGGQDDERGGLRIRVKPREAKVRVDGYFVGTVDDFDGNFQKLRLDDGPHKVELLLDGYNSLLFDVMIIEGQTVTYKGKMKER